ncbi:MAG TPA: BON domain-containing protein [Candidatus Acidoferrum sp.]|nr:BON domain-containing protein [Candidatus Acidoferrum sp.]
MRKNILISSIGAAGTAAALMFFLDPKRGRRRRALVRDKALHLTKGAGVSLGRAGRDLGNRSWGLAAGTWSLVRPHDSTDDEVLAERVRSRIGRIVRHTRAIEISARDGVITLAGDIAQSEVPHVMRRVYSVRGVKDVHNQMRIHQNERDVPGFSIAERAGNGGFLRRGQAPGIRLALGAAGGALAVVGSLYRSRHTHPVLGKVLSSAGISLLGTEVMDSGVSQLTHRRTNGRA